MCAVEIAAAEEGGGANAVPLLMHNSRMRSAA
jgi:hypothetical protein